MRSILYRSKKTGILYLVLDDDITDCTNVRAGTRNVLYVKLGEPTIFFTREYEEFMEAFELKDTYDLESSGAAT